jgi:hypothetical protein
LAAEQLVENPSGEAGCNKLNRRTRNFRGRPSSAGVVTDNRGGEEKADGAQNHQSR